MDEFIKKAKQFFMAYRNGIVADSLRKAGMPYRIIFGLQLPQIRQLAKQFAYEIEDPEKLCMLARQLWDDAEVRESRMLALAVLPKEKLSLQEAESMAASLLTREEIDLFTFLLLKDTPHVPHLLRLLNPEDHNSSYLREALSRYL